MSAGNFDLKTVTKSPITKSISSVLLTIFVAVLVVVFVFILMTTIAEPSLLEEECETAKKDRESINSWFTAAGFGSALFAGVAGFALWHGSQTEVISLPTDPVNFPPHTGPVVAVPPPSYLYTLKVCRNEDAQLRCRNYMMRFDTPEAVKLQLSSVFSNYGNSRASVLCRQGNVFHCYIENGNWKATFHNDLSNIANCTAAQLNRFAGAVMSNMILPTPLQAVRHMLDYPGGPTPRLVACHHINGKTNCEKMFLPSNSLNELNVFLRAFARLDQSQPPLAPVSACKLGNNYFVVLAEGTAGPELQSLPQDCNRTAIEDWLQAR